MTREELIKTMVTEVMEDFDFDRVHRTMRMLNWQWAGAGNRTPSMYRLMSKAEKLLTEAAQNYGSKEFYTVGEGGFEATLDNGTLTLRIILTEYSVDHRDYIKVK